MENAYSQIATLVYWCIGIAFSAMLVGRVIIVKYLKSRAVKVRTIKLIADITTPILFAAGFLVLWYVQN